MPEPSAWSTRDERTVRMALALRLIERLDKRLSLQSLESILAILAMIMILAIEAVVLALARHPLRLGNGIGFFILLAGFALSVACGIASLVFACLSLGFRQRLTKGNLLHPFHPHPAPCTEQEFAGAFAATTQDDLWTQALEELYWLRVHGKARFAHFRNALYCLGAASGIFLLAGAIGLFFI